MVCGFAGITGFLLRLCGFGLPRERAYAQVQVPPYSVLFRVDERGSSGGAFQIPNFEGYRHVESRRKSTRFRSRPFPDSATKLIGIHFIFPIPRTDHRIPQLIHRRDIAGITFRP